MDADDFWRETLQRPHHPRQTGRAEQEVQVAEGLEPAKAPECVQQRHDCRAQPSHEPAGERKRAPEGQHEGQQDGDLIGERGSSDPVQRQHRQKERRSHRLSEGRELPAAGIERQRIDRGIDACAQCIAVPGDAPHQLQHVAVGGNVVEEVLPAPAPDEQRGERGPGGETSDE